MPLEATNNAVWVIRDETPDESNGLILTEEGKVKPHTGTIISTGELVKDSKIRKGVNRKCLWHKTVGQEIDYNGTTYLVLTDEQILAVL